MASTASSQDSYKVASKTAFEKEDQTYTLGEPTQPRVLPRREAAEDNMVEPRAANIKHTQRRPEDANQSSARPVETDQVIAHRKEQSNRLTLLSPLREYPGDAEDDDDDEDDPDDKGAVQIQYYSRDKLIEMDHDAMEHVSMDLWTPERATWLFPPSDLAPLALCQNLRTLALNGMMRSFQSSIWLVVWLNPKLTSVTLGMANEGERLDCQAIETGREQAAAHRAMRGESEELGKLRISRLGLINFKLDAQSFTFFDAEVLDHVWLRLCQFEDGFEIPRAMQGHVNFSISG